jgi:hypothetical protein
VFSLSVSIWHWNPLKGMKGDTKNRWRLNKSHFHSAKKKKRCFDSGSRLDFAESYKAGVSSPIHQEKWYWIPSEANIVLIGCWIGLQRLIGL